MDEAPPQTELQRLTAVVQHQLNNPLAALLAEAQLLGMEPALDASQRAAVERIVELVRRVIGTVRNLDTVVEAKLSGQ
ncbi:MAG TPA: histidine kinase dimerization/phospho-acceptor domain-containing protein [Gemmatimonadaceae bacterium]|nr:histidine kinase dimerization/phospho-acceptor domain-containing protein [Gemmatimonadaceae bacterium]